MPHDRTKILADVLDHAPIQVWGVDQELRLTYLDGGAVASALARSLDGFIGHPLREILTEDTSWILERHRKAFEGTEQSYEVRWLDTDFWVHLRPPSRGETPEVHGIAVEITELNEARKRLRDLEDTRAFALEASGAGLWHFDLDPDDPLELDRARLYLSPELLAFIGFGPGEGPATLSEWSARILDRDRLLFEQAVADHLAGRSPSLELEYRIRHRDGSLRCLRAHGRIGRDEEGRPVRFAGLDFDITSQRMVAGRWDHLLSHLRHAVLYQDAQGTVTEINEAVEELFGVPRDDLVGRNAMEVGRLFVGRDGAPLDLNAVPPLTALREHRVVSDVIVGVRPPSVDEPRWVRATSVPRLGPEGEPVEVFTSLEEVSSLQAR